MLRKSMKALFTADLHLTDNPRDAYRHDAQKRIRAKAKKEKVDATIILGDLTEEKDRHSAWLVNAIVDHIWRLSRIAPVLILRGNHDYLDARSPFYEFLKRIDGVLWLNAPTEASALPDPFQGLGNSLFLPHPGSSPDLEWKGIDLKAERDYVFTHLTFNGCRAESGEKLKGVPVDLFGETPVISGDIHMPQKVGETVTYVGSPYLVDFGDRFEPRIIILDDWKMRSIRVGGPQKRLVSIQSLKELEPGSTPIRYVSEGDILKVRMLISEDQKAEWPNLRNKIRDWGSKAGYYIHVVEPLLIDTVRGRKSEKKKRKVGTKDDAQVLTAYGKAMGLDKLTMKAGHNLLEKA